MKISVLNGTAMYNKMIPTINGNMANNFVPMNGNMANVFVPMNGNMANNFVPLGCCNTKEGWSTEDYEVFNGASDHEKQIFDLAVALGDPDAVSMNGLKGFLNKIGDKLQDVGGGVKNLLAKVGAAIPGEVGDAIEAGLELFNITPQKKQEMKDVSGQIYNDAKALGIDPAPNNILKMANDVVNGDEEEKGWWSQRSDMEKAGMIGGGLLLTAGGIYLATRKRKKRG